MRICPDCRSAYALSWAFCRCCGRELAPDHLDEASAGLATASVPSDRPTVAADVEGTLGGAGARFGEVPGPDPSIITDAAEQRWERSWADYAARAYGGGT